MVKRSGIIILICIALLALFFFFQCSKQEQGVPVVFAFWGTTEEIDIIHKTVKPWDEARDDLHVVFQHVPVGGGQTVNYVQKILTQMAGNTAPDVIFMEVNIFVDFCFKDVLVDLTPYIKNDNEFNIKDFYPGVVDRFTYQNKIYVIPRDTAPFNCVFYNKDLFDRKNIPYPKNDWTWDDLVRIGKQLIEKDDRGFASVYAFYAWPMQNFIYSAGGGYVDNVNNPGKCLMGAPGSREGLQFYHDMMWVYGIMPKYTALADADGMEMFETGRLAMYGSGIWESPRLRKIKSFDWDVVPFPRHPRKGLKVGTGGSGYSILKSCKHPDKAWELIKCLSGDYGQSILGDTGLAQPAKIKIAASEHFAYDGKKPTNKQILLSSVRQVVYEPFVSEWNEIYKKYISAEIEKYIRNLQTLDETVNNMVPKVNEALKDKQAKK